MKIIVDIYEQVFDELGFHSIETNHLCTICYEADKDIVDLSYELHHELSQHKGDGFHAKISEVGEFVFIRIDLFEDREHHYIIEYMDALGIRIDYPEIEGFQQGEYLLLENFDEALTKELVEEINNQKNGKKVVQSVKMFERGAGDWRSELIFAAMTGIPIGVTANFITDWLKRKGENYSRTIVINKLDSEEILKQTAKLSGINQSDLVMTDLEYDEHEEIVFISITNRYADITVHVNSSNEIVNFKMDKKSQTRI